ncbi:MAG: hypothetical protein ACREIS_05610 [Nitrospiraceae bacterium]
MAQVDFEDGIAGVESGVDAAKEVNLVTMFTQLDAAIGVRLAAAVVASPANKKLQAFRLRVRGMANEADAQGAGLVVKQVSA